MPDTLVDRFGRIHTSLRISVTDRCNIRCFYCMPLENIQFQPRAEILTFEEIERLVRVGSELGIRKLRLTGGEPLVRSDLPQLVKRLRDLPGIEEIALTTNGILLDKLALQLKDAGLDRINISIDTLDEDVFERITRRRSLARVLEGIAAAQEARFASIKLNAVAIRDLSEPEIVPLAKFAREQGLELRFIEFMPLDADRAWDSTQVLSGEEIVRIVSQEVAPLVPIPRSDPAQPATDFAYADQSGKIGFINSVTQAFCAACNRMRLTAEGQFRNCLFSTEEWDARAILRGGGSDKDLRRLMLDCVDHKRSSHGIDSPDFHPPARAMYQIGG